MSLKTMLTGKERALSTNLIEREKGLLFNDRVTARSPRLGDANTTQNYEDEAPDSSMRSHGQFALLRDCLLAH